MVVPKENRKVAEAILADAVREARNLERPDAFDLDRIASQAIDASPHIPDGGGYDFDRALAVCQVWHYVRAELMAVCGVDDAA